MRASECQYVRGNNFFFHFGHAFYATFPTNYFLDLNVCCLIFSGVFNGLGSPNRDHFSDTDLYVRCDSNPVRVTAWGTGSIKPSAIMTAVT